MNERPSLSYADVAQQFGVTRSEVCHYVTVARKLCPDLLAVIEARPPRCRPSLRLLLKLARMRSPTAQLAAFSAYGDKPCRGALRPLPGLHLPKTLPPHKTLCVCCIKPSHA